MQLECTPTTQRSENENDAVTCQDCLACQIFIGEKNLADKRRAGKITLIKEWTHQWQFGGKRKNMYDYP